MHISIHVEFSILALFLEFMFFLKTISLVFLRVWENQYTVMGLILEQEG